MINEQKPDEALDLFNQALRIRTELNNSSGLICLHHDIAAVLSQKADSAGTIMHLQAAMKLAHQMKDKYNIATTASELMDAYRVTEAYLKEKESIDLCLQVATEQGYKELEAKALAALAKWYEREGEYKAALQTYWRYQDIKDLLIQQDNIHTVQEMRVKMQVEEKEREIALTRKINLALEQKNRLISRQKLKLEKAEKALIEWNHTLESRVTEETRKRQQQEQIVIQKSKLESLGRLAAGIAHEINQPLGMINIGIHNLFNKLISGGVTQEYITDKRQYFTENIDRIRKIIDHIRIFSRDQQSERSEKNDARDVINNALSMMQNQCKAHNIKIDIDLPDSPMPVYVNKNMLEQVLLNLTANAKDAVQEKFDEFDDSKRIRIRGFRSEQTISIEVEDNGSGIPSENLDRIFEPFFTTKSESMGTGLGLSICIGIIQSMQGTITCRSEMGSGTVMAITLPACI